MPTLLRRHLRPLSAIALLAMLALALLPTLSHAWASARGGSVWAEVCTPQGVRLVALDGDGPSNDGGVPMSASAHLEHCPFCGSTPHAAPPPAQAAPAVPAAVALHVPPHFLHAPRTLHAWRSAQPRGPPSLS
jgi:hypothetical protein